MFLRVAWAGGDPGCAAALGGGGVWTSNRFGRLSNLGWGETWEEEKIAKGWKDEVEHGAGWKLGCWKKCKI